MSASVSGCPVWNLDEIRTHPAWPSRSHRYEVRALFCCGDDMALILQHSVRSTNVYEEKSLGVYHDDDDADAMTETGFNTSGNRAVVWGRYLTMHARRQLSFGASVR